MVTPPTPVKPARRFLRFSLRTFLLVTLALSLALGTFGRLWLKAYRDSQPPTLHELAQIAKRHGIPMPPEGAKLVLAKARLSFDFPLYSPAFVLEERADGSILVLRGADEELLTADRYVLFDSSLDPNTPLVREFLLDVDPQVEKYEAECECLSAFIVAAQLADRGDQVRANLILDRFVKAERWEDADYFFSSVDNELLSNPRLLVARCAYDHLERRMLSQPRDWPEVRTRMEELLAEFPKLQMDDSGRDIVLRDLAAAVDAPSPAPGSVEALLITWSRTPTTSLHTWSINLDDDKDKRDEPVRQIVLQGFTAVPELVRLCADRRMTAHVRQFFNSHHGPEILRLDQLAEKVLWNISGRWPNGSRTFSIPGPNPVDAEGWRKWWEEAEPQGERQYCQVNVFQATDASQHVRLGPALILAEKHPQHLRETCEEFTRKSFTSASPFPLAQAVAVARLSKSERVQILAEFAQRGTLADKRQVLHVLALLDNSRCAEILLPLIEQLPPDVEGTYARCPEAALMHLVAEVRDVRVWRAALRAARRGSIGLRMEMTEPHWIGGIFSGTYLETRNENRSLQLAYWRGFLDDESLRDTSNDSAKFKECAGDEFPQITVRDFAAAKIAQLLEIKPAPDASWSPAQWSTLREQVRERLKGEKLPELE